MVTSWQEHIKKVREEGNFTYKEAMVAASKSWKRTTKARPKKPKTAKVVETPPEPVDKPAPIE